LQPSGNLLGRPVLHQFTRNDLLQLAVGGQQACFGPQGRLPGLLIGLVGSILRAPAMAGYLSAYRAGSATQTLGDDPQRAARWAAESFHRLTCDMKTTFRGKIYTSGVASTG